MESAYSETLPRGIQPCNGSKAGSESMLRSSPADQASGALRLLVESPLTNPTSLGLGPLLLYCAYDKVLCLPMLALTRPSRRLCMLCPRKHDNCFLLLLGWVYSAILASWKSFNFNPYTRPVSSFTVMDPVTVIGAAGAAADIVKSLNSMINSLHTLYTRWKGADFLFLNMVTQLTALKAALNKIHEWMLSDTDDAHHQLVIDLDSSLKCCQMLVSRIEHQLSEMHLNGAGLDAASKVKLTVGGKSMEEVQKMLERQTSALTLLLTACNWYLQGPVGERN